MSKPSKYVRPPIIPELDKLYQNVLSYRSSEAYKGMIEFIRNFPNIAPYNAMLLHMQFPGCRLALTAEEWWGRYRRSIKLGARPMIVLRTFGPISFVFDIIDTEGEPVPQEVLNPLRAVGEVNQNHIEILKYNMLREGVRYSQADQSGFFGGFIVYGGIPEKIVRINEHGKDVNIRTVFEIVVNKNSDAPTQFATLIHELGHFYCGHGNNPRAIWLPKREKLDKDQREFEAESVSWMVCQRLGIKSRSTEYLSGYLSNEEMIPDISIDAVVKAVGKIERLMQSSISPRKELVIKEKSGS